MKPLTIDPRTEAGKQPPNSKPVPGIYRSVELTSVGFLISHWVKR